MKSNFVEIDKNKFRFLICQFEKIQRIFLNKYSVDDIFSNSKIYEIIIANVLHHELIPGHSGSKDAKDKKGNVFEYKHFKESSSNHTWTFNDYSNATIEDLKKCIVIFAHIDDSVFPSIFDWYYEVDGKIVSSFLSNAVKSITNSRKMINISKRNIEDIMKVEKKIVKKNTNGLYTEFLNNISKINKKLEKCTNVNNLLTSNKIWEVLVAVELNHNVNSEQGGRSGGHDAFDKFGNYFEYKVSKNSSWNFQDISENVLNKYETDNAIILAIVDKTNFKILEIYSAKPAKVVKVLKKKLLEKEERFSLQNKEIRRKQVSISKGDLKLMCAIKIK